MHKPSLSACGQIVKDNDPDRFLLSMMVDARYREALWAIFAFNYEIAKTRDVVSESTLGLIRLQWWREEIAKIYRKHEPTAHEVLIPLAQAIKQYSLNQDYFHTLIYAREFDLENIAPSSMEGLLHYADFTSTPLMKLVLQIMGDDPDMTLVYPVAVNYALSGILRSIVHHALNGRSFLPESLTNLYGLDPDHLFEASQQSKLNLVVRDICLQQVKGIHSNNRFLLASDCLADLYFSQIKSLKYNVFSPRFSLDPPFKVLRMVIRTGLMSKFM